MPGPVLAITAWETHAEDRAREARDTNLTALAGSPVAQFMKTKFDEEMKRFHNPTNEKTSKLFTDYTAVRQPIALRPTDRASRHLPTYCRGRSWTS